MGAAIEVQDVWKSFRVYQQRTRTLKELLLVRRSQYETFWALKGVTFDVPRGEMVGIVGPNGSGKSTTLKTLARIYTPNQGRVVTHGKISAMLELGTGFHPELSGRDNLYLAGSIMGLSTSDVADRFDAMVDFAGIGDFVEAPVKNYSSGMFARLAFALAINVDAEILLIDEVLAVGDESFQQKCHERIDRMRRDGVTIVYVTHALNVVRDLCTMAVWIQEGRVVTKGEATEVVDAYFDEAHAEDAEKIWVPPEKDERSGNGEARITKVRTLGPDGAEHRVFHPGEPLTVEFEYETTRNLDEVVMTVELRRLNDDDLVTTVTTLHEHQGIELPKGGGRFVLQVPALPLVEDVYTIGVRMHHIDGSVVYDWVHGLGKFSVSGWPPRTFGDLAVPSSWKIEPGPAPR